jgi:hypothetical protein
LQRSSENKQSSNINWEIIIKKGTKKISFKTILQQEYEKVIKYLAIMNREKLQWKLFLAKAI